MSALVRLLGLAVAAIMLASSAGELTMLLVLVIALNVGLIATVVADLTQRRGPEQEARQLHLRRRMIPHLRARHPTEIVQAQVLWREAAEAHRRARESA